MTHEEAMTALRERFAAQGVTEIVEWEDRSEQELTMRYGLCGCGQPFRVSQTWTLSEGGQIGARLEMFCANGHVMA